MQSGKFYWIKGGLGYPWDIQLYDSKYIYLWITELSWTVRQTYKKFTNNTNLPLVPRCATAGFPGPRIKVANTNCDLHKLFQHLFRDAGIAERDQPSLGAILPLIRRQSSDQHEDASDQLSVQLRTPLIDKEEYYLSQRYGLVQ